MIAKKIILYVISDVNRKYNILCLSTGNAQLVHMRVTDEKRWKCVLPALFGCGHFSLRLFMVRIGYGISMPSSRYRLVNDFMNWCFSSY